jgi:hypothetical protein
VSRTFVPHKYQQEALDWLYDHPRTALWMPMGGGKTVTTLTALDALDLVEGAYPVLVLAPKRVAVTTWPDEVDKWAHLRHLRIVAITGTPKQRKAALDTPADIYTMAYDNLVWLCETLGAGWPFITVVADELTRLKSFRIRQGSKRAGALGKVAHSKVRRFVGLTGTPGANGLKDLWGQTWFLDKGERLGRTFTAFEQRWFTRGYDGFSLQPLPHAQEEIQDLLQDICLTVTGLPVDEPIRNPIYVDLPPTARVLYDDMEEEMFAQIGADGVEAANAAVRTQKCLQIANGAIYTNEGSEWEAVHDAKLEALDSVIEEANGAPVLVAYNFKHDLARLRHRFRQARVLDADPDTIRQWNAGRIEVLLAHPACLTPQTEVLTENRGWVSIVEVQLHERVHDGVEFVNHRGCSFSGVKPVISVFGVEMTPDHKLLIGENWVEASHVRDTGRTSREARYTYTGDDRRTRALFEMRDGATRFAAKREQSKPPAPQVLQALPAGYVSPDDRDAVLPDLEGYGQPRNRPEKQGLRSLWRFWPGGVRCLVGVRELLSGYARRLRGRSYNRQGGQLKGLLPGELPVGAEPCAAVEQKQQPRRPVQRAHAAFGRVLPGHRHEQGRGNPSLERRDDGGRGGAGLPEIDVQTGPKISPVYDLVDCGPRNRFLIRNAQGEVFISHNSAGHGLSLQDGGNILAFFGLDWSLENHLQIIERIGPMRQKQAGYDRPVFVHYIMARDTVDDMVLDRLTSKKTTQEVLLEAMKRRNK